MNLRKKIQEEVSKNVKVYSNPLIADVKSFVNFYRENQSDNSSFSIKIDCVDNSNIKLNIGYSGNQVNEKYPEIQCLFTNSEYFQESVLPYLIQEHVIDGGIKGYNIEENKVSSENLNGESLKIAGSESLIKQTEVELQNNVYVDDMERKQENTKVRKLEIPNKYGVSNFVGITILLVAVIVALILLFVLL